MQTRTANGFVRKAGARNRTSDIHDWAISVNILPETTPYPHLVLQQALPYQHFHTLQEIYRRAKWERYERGSYQYDVFCVYKNDTGEPEKWHPAVTSFKNTFQHLNVPELYDAAFKHCNVRVKGLRDITFHRMRPGDFSHRHTDVNPFGEVFRIVLYLNKATDFQGGRLLMYRSRDAGMADREFVSIENTAIGFGLTEPLYHEVETVLSGERSCVILTYC